MQRKLIFKKFTAYTTIQPKKINIALENIVSGKKTAEKHQGT